MRFLDAFNHYFPQAMWDRMLSEEGAARDIGKRMRNIPCIFDLPTRERTVDLFRKDHDYQQVLSLGMPPLDIIAGDKSPEFAKLGNDGLAELCAKDPVRFPAFLASLPMNKPDEAAKEAERILAPGGAVGLQIHTNVGGHPIDEDRFWPIFEIAEKMDRPIFLHPSRGAEVPDYLSETKSKYEIWWTFGWPYETSVAMARLVFSGIMDKMPNLKVLSHHLGAMVPYFEGRVGPGWDQLGKRTSDEDYVTLLKNMKKRPLDYFKDFYADSATFGSRSATVCGLDFYGADKVLFASDCPFDPEGGTGYIRETIAILEGLELSQEDREKICYKNALKLFRMEGH
jgi:predicted TIM-barrel fold metal-dependent hydrolase